MRVDSKEAQKGKTSFPKETVENADLHKAILNKAITTQEQCIKNNSVAPLNVFHCLDGDFEDYMLDSVIELYLLFYPYRKKLYEKYALSIL